MKIIIDDKIPYIKGVFENKADVIYLPGAEISNRHLADADALIVRTRTRCTRELLEGTSVKYIATATIGFDHIDTSYCNQAGIAWSNAPGCNAESVNQYLASALTYYAAEKKISLKDKTIGIIGVGNVGSRVARTAGLLGMKVLLNDPPRARKEGPEEFVDLRNILANADIISLHVPLNMDGLDKTWHMVNKCFLELWQKKELLINTCRGEVMETSEVAKGIKRGTLGNAIVDCWENEPDIDPVLLDLSMIGTPHIAGYSRDGKANGTSQCVQAVSRFFKLGIDNFYPDVIEAPFFPNIIIEGSGKSEEEILSAAIQSTYEISHDDRALRENPQDFEKLRGDYPVRREFHAYKISPKNIDQSTMIKLNKLGFKQNNYES
jgi:erythronate-4-phosphate dehydrogenase